MKRATRSAHSLLCDVTLVVMSRSRINTGKQKSHPLPPGAIILFVQCPRYLYYFYSQLNAMYGWSYTLLLQMYVRKGNDAKNPEILGVFFVTKRTQSNAAHA